jgi:glycosyltransferase involved in cell wall biosynthesis
MHLGNAHVSIVAGEKVNRRIVISANTSWYIYNFRKNTISEFLRSGFEVFALGPKDTFSDKLEDLGCRFVPLQIRPSGKNPFAEAYLILQFLWNYLKIRPSVAFHFTIKCNLYGSLAARIAGIPYINNISGLGTAFNSDGPLNRLIRWMYRLTQRGAKRVFLQNPSDFELLAGRRLIDPRKAEVLPGSGVDIQHFQPHFREVEASRFTFIFAGRILWEKGLNHLADAMRSLSRSGVRVRCLVYGFTDDSDPKYVPVKTLREWENEGLLEYMGPLQDVREAYVNGDCVVLPSFYREGIPRSLLEAAAMAKPIVATDWVGCREAVIHGVNGLLCKVKDSESLAAAMLRICTLDVKARRQMGDEGRRLVVGRFNERVVIQKYVATLEQASQGT